MTTLTLLSLLLTLPLAVGITHALVLNWNRSSEAINTTVTITAESEQNFDITVPDNDNVVVVAAIDVSQLSLVFIKSDVTITFKNNDDGTPDDTLTITAGKPLVWYSGCGLPNPFASGIDVASFKLTNATAGEATVKIRFAYEV